MNISEGGVRFTLPHDVARHTPDEVTEAMDRVCAAVNDERDDFVTAAGRRVLERVEG